MKLMPCTFAKALFLCNNGIFQPALAMITSLASEPIYPYSGSRTVTVLAELGESRTVGKPPWSRVCAREVGGAR